MKNETALATTTKPLVLTYDMEVRGAGFPDYTPKITVFTTEGYARKNGEDPAELVAHSIKRGYELAATTGGMSVMTADYPGKAEAHAKALAEREAAPVLDNGDLVVIEGRLYAVRLAGANYADPIHFTPVKAGVVKGDGEVWAPVLKAGKVTIAGGVWEITEERALEIATTLLNFTLGLAAPVVAPGTRDGLIREILTLRDRLSLEAPSDLDAYLDAPAEDLAVTRDNLLDLVANLDPGDVPLLVDEILRREAAKKAAIAPVAGPPKLKAHDGKLYTAFEDMVSEHLKAYYAIPHKLTGREANRDALLMYEHPGGDHDTIGFPDFNPDHLRGALYDARETGAIDDVPMVLLPDGTEFLIDV